jgi:hypothetical protein
VAAHTYAWNIPIGQIQIRYTLNGGAEIASNTLYVAAAEDDGTPTGLDIPTLNEGCTIVRDGFEAMVHGLSWYTGTVIVGVTGYLLASASPWHATADTMVSGTNQPGTGTQAQPPEVAAVASLYGYSSNELVPQRARKRGRIYLPGLSTGPLSTGGLFSSAFTSFVSTSVAGVLQDLWDNGGGTARMDPVVASRTGSVLTSIQRVVVDNHPDVQRRRQNALPRSTDSTAITR